jgi:hypothetical protein
MREIFVVYVINNLAMLSIWLILCIIAVNEIYWQIYYYINCIKIVLYPWYKYMSGYYEVKSRWW